MSLCKILVWAGEGYMYKKVSIVIPLYKVEKHINRCVDSIINQTYTNIEIILVDDGSPDNCGKIADEYAEKDMRIRVVHKHNGGVSDTRNYGMLYVTGEFTLFVDSDDWLAVQMVEVMVEMSHKFGADIVQTAFYYAYEDHLLFDDRYYLENSSPVVLDSEALMSELVVNERVKNFAWGKLYKTDIVKDIPFKKGVLFEDVFWAHKVMQKVETYVILNKPMYYYYQRSDSITANYTLRSLDIISGLKERHCFIEQNYSHLAGMSYKFILKTCFTHYNMLLLNGAIYWGSSNRREIRSYIISNFNRMKKAAANDRQLYFQLCLFRVSPVLYILFLAIGRILRKLGIIPEPNGLKYIHL